MRKALLLLAVMILAGSACPWVPDVSMAAGLEPTDSGAPSAIVIFPVGEKPNPEAAAMPPVAFNHLIHEKWMARAGKDCMVCHHTGDPVACTNCHTVEGSAKGNYIPLERAMHAEFIRKRSEFTPSSCVSCHVRQTRFRDCAGCHDTLVRNARKRDSWCAVCHTISPKMTVTQMQQGIQNKLSASQNESIAEATALSRKQTVYWSPNVGPYKVSIGVLSKDYGPCVFNHRHHVDSLQTRIQENRLAGVFHTTPGTVCVTCHHNTPPSARPPKCSSCHATSVGWQATDKPALKAAYHLQCMSCHTDMKVARPRSTDCYTCHKPIQGAMRGGL